jgi:hypothetical protein
VRIRRLRRMLAEAHEVGEIGSNADLAFTDALRVAAPVLLDVAEAASKTWSARWGHLDEDIALRDALNRLDETP